ncbi:hypothetical protein [Cerasicoccus maritimus]|uniref:hypothetical protein n=1 Tax=Cerasicoccus maritimus TaxID=490089 RepID=UPI002852A7E7|nr:hypothetical protein [Cerasicoccus maritimus]
MKPITSHVNQLLTITSFLIGTLALRAGDVFKYKTMEITGNEQAVLVLCPGLNQNGDFFLKEKPWVDFAHEHELGLIALSFQSDVDKLYNSERKGYYWPEQGSGAALLSAIKKSYGKELPILIYGFSGGAHFASRFVEWKPEQVVAWTAYSAQFWDSPQEASVTPPGIVACGEHDSIRWQPTFAYFYEGRQLKRPWTWISLAGTGHARHRAFEQFIRDYFAAALDSSNLNDSGKQTIIFIDVDTEELFVNEQDTIQPAMLAVLPDGRLAEKWKAVHAQ